jgi:hypothetical protein
MVKRFFNKYIGFILLAGALIIGLKTYKSYGINWDDQVQRGIGTVSYNFLFHGDDSLNHYCYKEYGTGFELPLVIIEKALNLQDNRDVFFMRHLVTHLFFLLGAFAFFLLIDYLYDDKLLASIGFLMYVVNPLIYAHSFYNTKDISFLSMLVICLLVTAIAFKKNNLRWYIILGIACAILMDIRILGVLLLGCIWIFFALDCIALKQDKAVKKKTLRYLLIFTCTTLGVLLIIWPYLWANPGQNIINAFKRMANVAWDGEVLFWGTVYPSHKIPVDFTISWFCISNPIIYLVFGFLGILYFSIRFIKNPKQFFFDKTIRNQGLFVFCFAEPLLSIVIFHSMVFDAWRHLYFIYPPFILVGIYGLSYVFKTKAKIPVIVILMAGIGYTGYYIASNFPYENIYFNEFVKKDPEYLRKNFDLDYWGTSYKQALEYIVKTDTAKIINVMAVDLPGKQNAWMLKPEDRKRLHFTEDPEKATYFATYYRNHSEDYPFQNKEVFSIKVLNSTIMSVFKLR